MKSIWFLNLFIFILVSCQNNAGKETVNSANNIPQTVTNNDPLQAYAWHLSNTGQTNFSANPGITGEDLRMTTTLTSSNVGAGVHVLVSDTGVEHEHEDLKDNFRLGFSKNYTLMPPWVSISAPPSDLDDGEPHGTMVAGIIAAKNKNGKGSRGVAPEAMISSTNLLSSGVSQTIDKLVDQASGSYDIFNYSYGSDQCSLSDEISLFHDQIKFQASQGRSGKGSLFIKAAGNEYVVNLATCGRSNTNRVGSALFDVDNNLPEMIVVSAFNASGVSASYSSPGSNIWVSAPGGEDGVNSPAILTTDRTGCKLGLSGSTYFNPQGNGYNSFESKNALNSDCSYTTLMNGTSSAAPMVSGAVAVLLGANPNLTMRDVKHILASTARKIHPTIPPKSNPFVSSPVGHTWEQAWITNAAGFHFHNWYGFGAVQLDQALQMATNSYQYMSPLVKTEDSQGRWIYSKEAINLDIPDFSSVGVSSSLNISHEMKVEEIQLRVQISHGNIGQIGLELTSPSGTKSIITNINNSLDGLINYDQQLFLTNAFYGESAFGNWTLKVIDGKSGVTGKLLSWKMNIYGNEEGLGAAPVPSVTHSSTSPFSTKSPLITWESSPSQNIASYEYSLGSTPGATDILGWTNNSFNTSVTVQGLTLVHNQLVYANVRSVSKDGLISASVSSSGWLVSLNGPNINILSPSRTATVNQDVSYTIKYTGANLITLGAPNVNILSTGTASATAVVTGSGLLERKVTLTNISGQGTLAISLAAGTASDIAGNLSQATSSSLTFQVDDVRPDLTIGSPSLGLTSNQSVSFPISISGASQVYLSPSLISLNKTGTANGVVSVSGSGLSSRTVTISQITGDGTLGITIGSGAAADSLGNLNFQTSPSTTFTVDNTGPSINISAPSASISNGSSVSYTLTFTDAQSITLDSTKINLIRTGTANASVSVTGAGLGVRTVTLSSVTGDGTLAIQVKSGVALDSINNISQQTAVSTSFTVDSTPPGISISSPSTTLTRSSNVSYTINYSGQSSVTLIPANINLITTGTATATVGVSGAGNTRTVTLSGISGDGNLSISLNAGTATDAAGNSAPAVGPSEIVVVDNTSPLLTISPPSSLVSRGADVSYTLTFSGASSLDLTQDNIEISVESGVTPSFFISGNGLNSRIVTLTDIDPSLTIGKVKIRVIPRSPGQAIATDSAGNTYSATSAYSETFTTKNWETIASSGAPAARTHHTTIWTGSEMIVFGGTSDRNLGLNNGARYSPFTNKWRSMTNIPLSGRYKHSAIWTGAQMLVWGGVASGNFGSEVYLNNGALFEPISNTWQAISSVGAPSARANHTAIWTGSEMIIFGGENTSGRLYDGGIYNISNNTWRSLPSFNFSFTATTTAASMTISIPSYQELSSLQLGAVVTGANLQTNTKITSISLPNKTITVDKAATATGSISLATTYNLLLPTTASFSGTTTNTSTTVTGVSAADITRIEVGQHVTGANIPANTTITSVAANSFTLSQAATGSATSTLTTRVYESHQAVWTGTEMILVGGSDEVAQADKFVAFNPVTNNWRFIDHYSFSFFGNITNGSNVVTNVTNVNYNNLYVGQKIRATGIPNSTTITAINEASSTITLSQNATSTLNSNTITIETAARKNMLVQFNGAELVIWGGGDSSGSYNTGSKYALFSNLPYWRALSDTNAPAARQRFSATQFGGLAYVWGGNNGSTYYNNGYVYDTFSDTWTTLPAVNTDTPFNARKHHTAIWTGSEMIIWGGEQNSSIYGDGVLYLPD